MRAMLLTLCSIVLVSCGQSTESDAFETVTPSALVFELMAEGELQSSQATPLRVPGEGWVARQLLWVAEEGIAVNQGDVLARFTTERGELDLTEALIELERNALARAVKQGDLDSVQGRVTVDLSKVAVDLSIAERYASADLLALARNQLLDAIDDVDFLGTRRDTLLWKQGQASIRGESEMAVIAAQRSTHQINADQARDDLDALELRAPHDGVMTLAANWAGEKLGVGSSLRPGQELGRLPDLNALEVELSLPQIEAEGTTVGNAVVLWPAGRPEQAITSEINWVASAPRVKSRQNPVRYLTMKVKVPAQAAREHGWAPGQRMAARIILLQGEAVLSVPNVAVHSEAGKHFVRLHGDDHQREVELGVRGPARSQVLGGLNAGDKVSLVGAVSTSFDESDGDRAGAEAGSEGDGAT